jgi:hypothetical protein
VGEDLEFLDFERLESLSASGFQAQRPYPWVNPEGALSPEGFDALRASLPAVDRFQARFGVARKFDQRPHDRFGLEWTPGLELPPAWTSFIAELQGDRYRRWLCAMFDVDNLELGLHWHYTPRGCSVSPHCDSKHKLGSHIFYLNTKDDWQPGWGGETLVLDDGGRFERDSAPDFEDFDQVTASESIGNRSFLFHSLGTSWHGVREVACPDDHYRKVFIVLVHRTSLRDRFRRFRHRLRRGY